MCRWIAYSGPPIYLEKLMVHPENSLIAQSRDAHKAKSAINADGFGIGWYNTRPTPGLFRDVYPAWNDENLLNVCQQIEARMFFGHVRASTGSAINRANCHPFRHETHLFMHNGQIGGFDKLRRELALAIRPEFFSRLQGTTDSEIFFYLALGNGLMENPEHALAVTIGQILDIMAINEIAEPFRITAALSDGETILAIRYSNDKFPPSLYYATDITVDADAHLHSVYEDGGAEPRRRACLILSEPLDAVADSWTLVPPSSLLIARAGHVEVKAFEPAPAGRLPVAAQKR